MSDSNETELHSMLLFQLLYQFQSMAMMHLGKIENPVSKKVERDLEQAKGAIELVRMLKEKTKGNLNEKENEFLEQILTNLQLNYADEVAKPNTPEEKKP